MSGGAMEFLYMKVQDAADDIPDDELEAMCRDFAEVLYAVEWWRSGDTTFADCKDAMDKFKTKWFGKRDEQLREIIDKRIDELKSHLYDVIGVNTNPKP